MKRVTMNQTQNGSLDGLSVTRFQQGEQYNLPEELANRFLVAGVARVISETPEAAAPPTELAPITDSEPTDAQVADVIRGLDPKNDANWTNSGKPDTRAIYEHLDVRPSAQQRDRVWAAMRQVSAR